jgi:hypothetical protein
LEGLLRDRGRLLGGCWGHFFYWLLRLLWSLRGFRLFRRLLRFFRGKLRRLLGRYYRRALGRLLRLGRRRT